MGYACPVCGTEEADAIHLANHFGVTASLGREDHLAWLETHAPDWRDRSPEELAEVVAERAPEVETPQFTTETGRAPSFEDGLARQARGPGRGELTDEAASVLEEAHELTREMYEDADRESREDVSDGPIDDGDADSSEEENT